MDSIELTQAALFQHFKFTCAYCARHVSVLKPDEFLTRDHVQPLSRGGRDVWANVVVACNTCNYRKGCRTPEEAKMPLQYTPRDVPQLPLDPLPV